MPIRRPQLRGSLLPPDIDLRSHIEPSKGGGNQPYYPPDMQRAMPAPQFDALVKATRQQGSLQTLPFTADTEAVMYLPRQESRTYLFVQNQDGASQIVVGIGKAPTVSGTTANGLIIAAGLGFWEPLVCPSDEIWILGMAAGLQGFLIWSTG